MLEIGTVVDGKYKILSKVGQGGMSVVYLALNERANKTWAIKEVRKDGVQDFATIKQRVIAEIDILKGLNHKYLPGIIDILDDDGTFIIVMDYIEGRPLDGVLQENLREKGLPIAAEDVISWGIQLCEVLRYLHTRETPIIYRDMKPSNVMLKPDGKISLIDFGTARIFKEGNSDDTTCLGTPGYAAPEQYGGNGQSGPRSDIYCLGATLHHLVTGRNPAATPFHFPPITQCRPALLEETPRELRNALLGLEIIIEKCTRYKEEERYQNCAQLQYALEHPEELGFPYRKKLKRKLLAFMV
ncbi:MAG TPA: serine/threonine protein kinase, partial [Lachnospiraceae bacterium]|nr:serine/threonine protein kinase [Lachnospiraceae bacterium]